MDDAQLNIKSGSPECLRNWMSDTDTLTIDAVLEWLHDNEYLTFWGENLARDFWEKYIKED